MRLRNALAVGVTAATIAPAVLTGSAAAAAAVTARAAAGTLAGPATPPPPARPDVSLPTCGTVSDPDFPIDTRIHGGPAVHHPGGGFEEWSVDLANTTGENCGNIHPVIVFTGRDPGLTPARITLEFHDDAAARWRPVTLETTSEDEIVGAFDDGFPGFVVPARKTVTIKVRLALAAGTPPNQVTVNAAVVQRRGDDGDWVGESGDYRFAVLDKDHIPGTTLPFDELATTGTGTLLRFGAAAGVILLGTGVLMLAQRRMRAGRR
ncbi:hypothetical protein FBY35_6328 [Streptomyces sp. SLBN-118]|uniref:hypothetical protein n=1 Tax=Streptomyces sp. SLBN-118 TaxID=2768454 RepID=UPI00114E1D1C|nr:hypothetical protein [Streptomyces sp. SLBN-118]TQK44801.1 hypothetical protein FBY35_6328 [Streptomyces sp. SLBN-118]